MGFIELVEHLDDEGAMTNLIHPQAKTKVPLSLDEDDTKYYRKTNNGREVPEPVDDDAGEPNFEDIVPSLITIKKPKDDFLAEMEEDSFKEPKEDPGKHPEEQLMEEEDPKEGLVDDENPNIEDLHEEPKEEPTEQSELEPEFEIEPVFKPKL